MTAVHARVQLDAEHTDLFNHIDCSRAVCCIEPAADPAEETLIYFEYFNKGAANVIFKVHPWSPGSATTTKPFQLIGDIQIAETQVYEGTPLPFYAVSNKVLRVPRGRAKCLTGEDIIEGFEDTIRPLFEASQADPHKPTLPQVTLSHHLMAHDAVALFPNVMEHLVAIAEDGTFEPMQIHTSKYSLTHRRWAMFLPDMSSTLNESVTLEIKPKWLLQSPNAPKNAIRCRTCAMHVATTRKRETYVCPLRFIEGDESDLRAWMRNSVATLLSETAVAMKHTPPSQSVVDSIGEHMLEYITKGEGRTLLHHLRRLQEQLDPHGVLSRDRAASKEQFDRDLRVAMTLRDCSLFIRFPYSIDGSDASHIASKLGDLDFKSAEKIDDWAQKESWLSENSAYTKEVEHDLGCWASRSTNIS